MCIAIYSPAGIELPTEERLRQSFRSNPDGAGFMYLEEGRVVIRKGYMRWGDFKAAWDSMEFKAEDVVGIHFRITTSGGTKPQNCHPFPIVQRDADLKLTAYTSDAAIIHNGIIGDGTWDLSDTMLFVRDTLAHPFFYAKLFTDKECQEYVASVTPGSKFCFLRGDGAYFLTGNWIEDADGNFYSNTSFKSAAPYILTGTWKPRAQGRFIATDDYIFDPEEDAAFNWSPVDDEACPVCGGENTVGQSNGLLMCSCGCYFDETGTIYANERALSCPDCGAYMPEYSADQGLWECQECFCLMDDAGKPYFTERHHSS